METKLAKWGNSVGLRLPKEVVARTGLQTGDALSISVERGRRIVLTPRQKNRITLAELLRGISPENLHAETGTGPPRGAEEW